ncbi:MAG: hypothetical protein HY222_08755 [Thaumarchaeota archaeon]|nr:hypothetical protein [Nitrososphaerota archaeon]MBI3642461.1 hypothetical protein [Nitrososphaerota archaeon]
MTRVPTVPKITLFSVFPVHTLLGQHEAGTIAKPTDKNELQEIWKHANQEFKKLDPTRSFLTPDDMRPLVLKDNEKITKMVDRLKKYPPYNTQNFGIYDVNISKLITPQISINLNRADKSADIKKEMSMDDLFDVSFNMSPNRPEIVRQVLGMNPMGGGAIQFTSYDEDIRIHSPPHFVNLPVNVDDPLGPSLESVSVLIGGGYPFASAYRVEINEFTSKLVLANGIHRVYKTASAGYQRMPLAVCDLTAMEFPNPFVDFPKEILLGATPPLLVDFLNPNVTIPLEYYTQLKTLRLSWNAENYTTVLK